MLLRSILSTALSVLPAAAGYAQDVTFTDVASSLGIIHADRGQFMGAGVSFADFNGDGLDDLTIPGGTDTGLTIFRNTGSGFEQVFLLPNTGETNIVLWADYDNDGDQDLFAGHYLASNRLYQNQGNGFMVDVTHASGISEDAWPTTAACWGDVNNDGWLDLFVANYSDESGLGPLPDFLFLNQGDGTFVDRAPEAGIADSLHHPLAASFIDIENDGWPDLFIANDKVEGNILYRNLGDGTFADVSSESGMDKRMNAMSAAVGDYDDDGFQDVYVTNTQEGNGLFRNNGDGTFTNVADSLGVAVGRICWGANFLDYDNDTDLDLFVSVDRGSPSNVNVLYSNNGDGTFTEVQEPGFHNDSSYSYGNAIGDFNNDGYPDIAVLNLFPSWFGLWESSGGSGAWVKVHLTGTTSNRDGIGSTVHASIGNRRFVRHMFKCGTGYLAQNSSMLTIGLGTSSFLDTLRVEWPSGSVTTLVGLSPNQTVDVVEGSSTHADSGPPSQAGYAIAQSYPNPFNSISNFELWIAKPSDVTLKIFNLLGQEVATLVSEQLTSGAHTFYWDAAGEPSGVYFYRLSARQIEPGLAGDPSTASERGFVETKKLVLMK